jgi:hypothetical protein
MGLFDGIRNWVVNIAIKKAVSKGAKAGVAAVLAPAVIAFLANSGVKVEVDNDLVVASVIAGVLGGYEFVRNFLKGKGLSFLP